MIGLGQTSEALKYLSLCDEKLLQGRMALLEADLVRIQDYETDKRMIIPSWYKHQALARSS